jgi:hypothetical protein
MRFVVKTLALLLATISVPAEAASVYRYDFVGEGSRVLLLINEFGTNPVGNATPITGIVSVYSEAADLYAHISGDMVNFSPAPSSNTYLYMQFDHELVGMPENADGFLGGYFSTVLGQLTGHVPYYVDVRTLNLTSLKVSLVDSSEVPPSGFSVWLNVPEPASWLMMIAGFGMVGIAMRHRRSLRVSFCPIGAREGARR